MTFTKKPLVRKLRYATLNRFARFSIALARMLPRSFGIRLFGVLGSMAFSFPHADRKRTIDHLRLIFGNEWDERTIRKTARSVYRELGKNLFDMFLLPRLSKSVFDQIVRHDPLDQLRKEYVKGKGCIMVTAHTGCFQMQLHFMAFHGFKVFAIGKKMHDEEFDNIVRSTRSGESIKYMDRSESPRKIVRYLQEGNLFGVLIDQDTSVEGVFADFMGITAYTPSGPVKMAMKLAVPLFVVTTARQGDDTHHVFIDGPVHLRESGDFEEDLVHNVTMVNSLICRTIRRYPSQWVWMHRRWKKQPAVSIKK
jgi:Kdo2-lipid IVA lauroyltransferase/acyltransferase